MWRYEEGMLVVLALLVLVGDSVKGRLSGPNVCQEEYRYTINVTEYFIRNSTVRNYEWCMNVPPRCSFYTTKLTNESREVEKQVIDLIDKCCSGFVEDGTRARCVSICPDCLHGRCVQGKCSCVPGYKGLLCDSECDVGEWGEDCRHRCDCASCNPTTGQCDSSTLSSNQFTIPVNSNGKFQIATTSTIADVTVTQFPQAEEEREPPVDDHRLLTTREPSPMMQTTTTRKEGIGDKKEFLNEKDVGQNDLVNSASAATAISVGIIIVAVVIVAARHFKGRKKDKRERSNAMSTVAVYTHSIFHTPLPEPPTFEGPIAHNLDSNSSNEGRFETHVVCSITTGTGLEYLYDHPPSTGSYRAASIPEPPDSPDTKLSEPLYDEIPAGITPISDPSSSLYMNTFAKTRF